jgi:hypothetical protein
MFEGSPDKQKEQDIEALESHPLDLLLQAALRHDLPSELIHAIDRFLEESGSETLPIQEKERPGSGMREITQSPELLSLLRAYNDYNLSFGDWDKQRKAEDIMASFP